VSVSAIGAHATPGLGADAAQGFGTGLARSVLARDRSPPHGGPRTRVVDSPRMRARRTAVGGAPRFERDLRASTEVDARVRNHNVQVT